MFIELRWSSTRNVPRCIVAIQANGPRSGLGTAKHLSRWGGNEVRLVQFTFLDDQGEIMADLLVVNRSQHWVLHRVDGKGWRWTVSILGVVHHCAIRFASGDLARSVRTTSFARCPCCNHLLGANLALHGLVLVCSLRAWQHAWVAMWARFLLLLYMVGLLLLVTLHFALFLSVVGNSVVPGFMKRPRSSSATVAFTWSVLLVTTLFALRFLVCRRACGGGRPRRRQRQWHVLRWFCW